MGAGEQMTEQHKENSLEDNHQSIAVIKRPHNQGPESKFLLTITQHEWPIKNCQMPFRICEETTCKKDALLPWWSLPKSFSAEIHVYMQITSLAVSTALTPASMHPNKLIQPDYSFPWVSDKVLLHVPSDSLFSELFICNLEQFMKFFIYCSSEM